MSPHPTASTLVPERDEAPLTGVTRKCREVGHHEHVEPTLDDAADHVGEQLPDDPDRAAQDRRRTLRELHARLRDNEQASDLGDDVVEELFAVTDDVLALEAFAVEERDREAHRDSSRTIYGAAAALVLSSAAVLVIVVVFGWASAWGITSLALAMAAGVFLAVAHTVAQLDGHRERTLSAILTLVAGLLVAALAPGWLPWWSTPIALLLLLLLTATFATTIRVDLSDTTKR